MYVHISITYIYIMYRESARDSKFYIECIYIYILLNRLEILYNMYIHIYIYIHMYIYREREGDGKPTDNLPASTSEIPTILQDHTKPQRG